ncbi:MAG: YciI family protein [Candidatus Dormibacteraeota bacterium]|nr:YciI family protein [Candidatus Dormibacteraeota bacterium]
MSRFLVTYHGSGVPTDPAQAEQARAAFGEWLTKAGKAVIDAGAPLRPGTQVSNGGASPRVMIAGYSVIEAANLEEAAEILRSHPFVTRGGTLQLDEAMAV